MEYDYHVHSRYSDGSDMGDMVAAAADAGLAGVGFADHADVATAGEGIEDLHETFEERRSDLDRYRSRADVAILDAAEVDYYPDRTDAIRAFVGDEPFDYTVGSVHVARGRAVMDPADFVDDSEADRRETVDRYFDLLVEMVDAELFDVAAHVDVVERNPHLREIAGEDHYRRVTEAFAASETVPEVNAGRVFSDLGTVHPRPEFLSVLQDAGVRFVFGSDSHTPDEVGERVEHLREMAAEWGVDPDRL